eukprot:CAMPEP_0119570894 /NCGR_PEP_ID=MMETSP1352-20130426/43845_1 /TAXON_ID=265584 /ORGANISM="Stauroneis constricta, Strain CCMP1120" /LENGTH=1450 /DNA_ID=CAMNT_0007620571 /DNA_START=222 /DNA_END=4574 /DNA_ORIENTATION=-
MTSQNQSGGLLGKLLLPGYTDAGAGTSFRPAASGDMGSLQQQQQHHDDDDDDNGPMNTSDAKTEVQDNRTSTRAFTADALAAGMASPSSALRTNNERNGESGSSGHHESKFGFFPSTNRSILRQASHDTHDAHHQQQQQQSPDRDAGTSPDVHYSMDPPSPPEVTRRQLPAPSVAATSVVPQIGGLVDELQERASHDEHDLDDGHQQHQNDHDADDFGQSSEVITTVTSASSSILGTQFLQKVKPMSETEDERDDLRSKLRQGMSSAEEARMINSKGSLSASTSPNSSARESLMDNNSNPDNDNDNEHEHENERHETASEVNSSAAFSDVNSTSSEMGTVINIANNRQRMAEVDAMAALIEASPAFQDYDGISHSHMPVTHPVSLTENVASSLALPTLEGDGDANRSTFTTKNEGSSTVPDKRTTLPNGAGAGADAHRAAPRVAMSSQNNPSPLMLSTAPGELLLPPPTITKRIGMNAGIRRPLTLSAPATPVPNYLPEPPRVEELLRSPKPRQSDPPKSFALRSPGSAARHELSTSMERLGKSSRSRRLLKQNRRHDFKRELNDRIGTTHAESTPHVPLTTSHVAFSGPLKLAQKCFSFDSTLDDYVTEETLTPPKTRSWERLQRSQQQQHIGRSGGQRLQKRNENMVLRQSASWDVGGSHHYYNNASNDYHSSSTIRHNLTDQQFRNGNYRGHRHARTVQRVRLDSDFSPSATATTMPLQNPQRVEIEREDALDILACLVERGVSLERNQKSKPKKQPQQQQQQREEKQGSMDDDGEEDDSDDDDDEDDEDDNTVVKELREDEQVEDVIDEIKKEIETLKDSNPDRHAARITAIDVLSRSHSYAMEMKRASLSASTWLKSIGKSEDSDSVRTKTINEQKEGGQASGEVNANQSSVDKIEITTLKALLHTAQLEAKEKALQADKLNAELSKCRAEIGRLQSAAKVETMVLTTTRSILDDAEDSVEERDDSRQDDYRPPSPIINDRSLADMSLNESLFRDSAERKSEQAWKQALEEANETIKALHTDLSRFKVVDGAPPVVSIEKVQESAGLQGANNGTIVNNRSIDEMNRTVNVRMLDGENFVTEWDDLTPPLPPPPDHGLRSPIVQTVLEQWTSDGGLHDSLMSWMESILSGTGLDNIPPLTISSLDHQVRDGFTMHVLPLLLRRADVHLTVQTRAHRRTTYDMAVTVKRKAQIVTPFSPALQTPQDRVVDDWSKRSTDFEQESTTHSAVTAHISNASANIPPIYSNSSLPSGDAAIGQLTDGRSVKSASSHDEFADDFTQSNQGIMGAIGGAIGGLLSRRKQVAATPPRFANGGGGGGQFHHPMRGNPGPIFENLPDGMQEIAGVALEEQPYHRVVSAPPGRIGMTFVEFRGHAMVSDVAPDSPLSGWVFPSDILIAIDEIPVSGMRVRDIIKVLTNRKDRQRALRVISSHAMNEFTLNQTAFDGGE